ncbi:MAG: hypothetical protein HZB39_00150 [Planctomycetes bacterium]|nr:hypothetical protein [Planctomycetota bacterium]
MTTRRPTSSQVLRLAVALALAGAATSQGPNRCISTDALGTPGNGDSSRPNFSADARFVVFQSSASDLVPGDANGSSDVFVKDRATGAIERVSVTSNGSEVHGDSTDAVISADARFVAFVSRAAFTIFDGNGTFDVYRHDRVTRTTELVSCNVLGLCGNDMSGRPSISGDGRYVAFTSHAGNLVPGDGNGVADVFVKDLFDASVDLVSGAPNAQPADLAAGRGVISRDGRWIAFDSYATNLVPNDTNGAADVFVRNLASFAISRCSVGPNGVEANGSSDVLDVSADGTHILFASWASNLVTGDTNGVELFVSDQGGGGMERVCVSNAGAQSNGSCLDGRLSGDARFVAFVTDATNLGGGDPWPTLDVYLRDRTAGTTVRASTNLGGGDPNSDCTRPALSDDGRQVAFASYASNLLFAHPGIAQDIVLADLRPAAPAGFATFGAGCRGSWGTPELDRDPATLPWTGTVLGLAGSRALGSSFGVVLVGLSRTNWNGSSLPLPLDAIGMPDCRLHVSIEATIPFATTSAGDWSASLPIPANSALRGVAVHVQGWSADPWANALGGTLSNAATATIGG